MAEQPRPSQAAVDAYVKQAAARARAKTVVIDIDGVIADAADFERDAPTWEEKFRDTVPLPGAAEALAELTRQGWYVVLHTARANAYRKLTKDWLKKYGIWHMTHYQELHCGKPCGILYVDDRGHRFTGWEGVFKALEETDG